MSTSMTCPLCTAEHENLIWQNHVCRVILVSDADYPGFCRVILQQHQQEMTDLAPAAQHNLMQVVFTVEKVIREVLQPDKINLASLGNVVPHLHWHIIPRYQNDRHFPAPIWAEPKRAQSCRPCSQTVLIAALQQRLSSTLDDKDGAA